MGNTQQKLETDDLDTLLTEAWPQLNRETQRRWVMYVTRLSMARGRRGADTETAIDELTTRILARGRENKSSPWPVAVSEGDGCGRRETH